MALREKSLKLEGASANGDSVVESVEPPLVLAVSGLREVDLESQGRTLTSLLGFSDNRPHHQGLVPRWNRPSVAGLPGVIRPKEVGLGLVMGIQLIDREHECVLTIRVDLSPGGLLHHHCVDPSPKHELDLLHLGVTRLLTIPSKHLFAIEVDGVLLIRGGVNP